MTNNFALCARSALSNSPAPERSKPEAVQPRAGQLDSPYLVAVHISYTNTADGVRWEAVRARLAKDGCDRGRSALQLQQSFAKSHALCLAHANGTVVGTARAVCDGAASAYIVDVWTDPDLRRRGIATQMLRSLLDALGERRAYLFTSPHHMGLYEKLGFCPDDLSAGKVGDKRLIARHP